MIASFVLQNEGKDELLWEVQRKVTQLKRKVSTDNSLQAIRDACCSFESHEIKMI